MRHSSRRCKKRSSCGVSAAGRRLWELKVDWGTLGVAGAAGGARTRFGPFAAHKAPLCRMFTEEVLFAHRLS